MIKLQKKKNNKKKETKKLSNFLKAHILGIAGVIYFRSGMCSSWYASTCTAS